MAQLLQIISERQPQDLDDLFTGVHTEVVIRT